MLNEFIFFVWSGIFFRTQLTNIILINAWAWRQQSVGSINKSNTTVRSKLLTHMSSFLIYVFIYLLLSCGFLQKNNFRRKLLPYIHIFINLSSLFFSFSDIFSLFIYLSNFSHLYDKNNFFKSSKIDKS